MKRSEPKLDSRDRKILQELQANSTITYRDLSDRVALSPSACVARVKIMEQANIIEGYHAHIAVSRIQAMIVMIAEITLDSHRLEDLGRYDHFLQSLPEVVEVLRVHGPTDYIVRIMLPSVEDWQPFGTRLLSEDFKVRKMNTHLVVQHFKPFKGYPVPNN